MWTLTHNVRRSSRKSQERTATTVQLVLLQAAATQGTTTVDHRPRELLCRCVRTSAKPRLDRIASYAVSVSHLQTAADKRPARRLLSERVKKCRPIGDTICLPPMAVNRWQMGRRCEKSRVRSFPVIRRYRWLWQMIGRWQPVIFCSCLIVSKPIAPSLVIFEILTTWICQFVNVKAV